MSNDDRRKWAEAYRSTLSEHQKAAGRHLYALAVAAATDETILTYSAAAASLQVAGRGFNARIIGDALDGLAGVCGALDTPDLSSLFERKSGGVSPQSRWATGDKDVERKNCYAMTTWPHLDALRG